MINRSLFFVRKKSRQEESPAQVFQADGSRLSSIRQASSRAWKGVVVRSWSRTWATSNWIWCFLFLLRLVALVLKQEVHKDDWRAFATYSFFAFLEILGRERAGANGGVPSASSSSRFSSSSSKNVIGIGTAISLRSGYSAHEDSSCSGEMSTEA